MFFFPCGVSSLCFVFAVNVAEQCSNWSHAVRSSTSSLVLCRVICTIYQPRGSIQSAAHLLFHLRFDTIRNKWKKKEKRNIYKNQVAAKAVRKVAYKLKDGGICVGECKLIKINLNSLLYTLPSPLPLSLSLWFSLLLFSSILGHNLSRFSSTTNRWRGIINFDCGHHCLRRYLFLLSASLLCGLGRLLSFFSFSWINHHHLLLCVRSKHSSSSSTPALAYTIYWANREQWLERPLAYQKTWPHWQIEIT